MSRIFISYHRDDSLVHVGWLRSLLSRRFGANQIFRDIETIPPGVDFVETIEAAGGSCEVLLAVIGPRWLAATNRQGQPRLDNPDDPVRVEIATALERNIRVIPVLVQDAHMPRSNELPVDIAKLARRNAVDLRDSTWDYDVGRLGDALESILQAQTNQVVQPWQQIDALMAQLLEAEARKDWDIVVATGEQILKIDPSHQSSRSKIAEAYRNRGNNRFNHRNFDEAVADYSRVILLHPHDADAHHTRSYIFGNGQSSSIQARFRSRC